MRAWERVRQCMHTDLGETMWRIWLRELEFLAFTDGTVYLAHASEVAVRHIKNQYAARLRMYWRAELPEARAVHISQKKATASTTTPMAKANATANTINAKQGNTQCNTQDNTMEISKTDSCANSHDPHASDNYLCVNTDLLFSPNDLPRKPMVSSEGDAYANEAKDRDRPVYANEDDPGGGFLDPRMTFANFINGTPNHLAIAAAQEVATHPNAYNPLFIHGGVGLGKTHLLQAIAWHIRNKAEVQKIVYLSAERFMTHFLHALKTNETARFMNRFRSVDVLIMDDLHFICGKQKTQEEFFHTYNTLISQHKQVILAADRSPADLSLGEKLQSRLNRGMVVKVNPTNIALRLEILKARIVWERIDLPDRVLNYLAQKITGNVRELEGALTRINGHMRLYGSIPNMEEINEILADIIRVNKKRITIASIQRMVARHYSVKPDELLSRRRTQDIVRPRQVAMYLAKNLTRCSYPEIGRHFGNRDHTTIMHGVRVIEKA
ncbi:MAG: chromosomal replication initiator protein DnaA, partial [Proteobacteria bacterium]|nr:chromosomal replication initiator protein DnaA [Pseudomonadota bacterium]